MKVLDAEKNIGINVFLTPYEGVNGKLRTKFEDFTVKEVSIYPPKKESGKFTIADVTANYWETNLLVRELSNWLHISRQRINFAGTKDKRAKTTRLMSFYKVPVENLSNVKIKDVTIENIYQSDHPVKIGNLEGNKFEIIIRDINKDYKVENIEKIKSVLQKNNGFPNFFGVQRFGIIRPTTHIVGKHIVFNDFEKAVMTYIAYPIKGEDEEHYKLRKKLEKTKDFSDALKNYPNSLNFEKAILNKLVNNPKDYINAIKTLPKNLLTMFVYAYQSFLFNMIISERIKQKIPLNKAVAGDIILPIRRGRVCDEYISVSTRNIDKVNLQISRGKAVVSGILFGSDSIFSEGDMGEIEKKIIESEKIDFRDFIIPEIPYISSTGSRRPILGSIKDFDFKFISDDINSDKKILFLKFQLNKGSYATSLLREFMKADDIRKY